MTSYILFAPNSGAPISPGGPFQYPPFFLSPLFPRLPGKIKKIMRDLHFLLSGKCWSQITLMEELAEEIIRVVPNRGIRDGNEPPTNRHRRKRNRRVRKDKRRFGNGSRLQRGRRDRRLRFAWVTYGIGEAQSEGTGRHRDRTSESAGPMKINAAYRDPTAYGALRSAGRNIVGCEATGAFSDPRPAAFGTSMNYCLNALRRNPAGLIHYVCDPQYGGPRYDEYRAEASVFLLDANCPAGDISYSDALGSLAMSTCRRVSRRAPLHTSGLSRTAAEFGLPSGSLGEMYWWSWLPPRSPWVILREFLLDFGVPGRTHRRGLFDSDFSYSGSFLGRDVSGRYVCYLYLWGPPANAGERAPTSGAIGMKKINLQLGPPPLTRDDAQLKSLDRQAGDVSYVEFVDDAKTAWAEGGEPTLEQTEIPTRSTVIESRNAESGPALLSTCAEELPRLTQAPGEPIISLLSSDEETVCREDIERVARDIANIDCDISGSGFVGISHPTQEKIQWHRHTQSTKRRRLGKSYLTSKSEHPVRVKEELPYDSDDQCDSDGILGRISPLRNDANLLCIGGESLHIQEHSRADSRGSCAPPYFGASAVKSGDNPPAAAARDETAPPDPQEHPANAQPMSGISNDLADEPLPMEAKYPFRVTAPRYNSQTPNSAKHPDGERSTGLPPGARFDPESDYPFRFTAPDYDAPITPCKDQTMRNAP